MKLNFNNIGQNNFLNIHRVNQSISRQNGKDDSQQSLKVELKDSVTISPQGKAKKFLENLMKQKMNITEQRKSLISRTLEKGDTLDSIKSELDSYDDQIRNIDNQIAEMMTKEMEKQAQKVKEQYDNNKPKTEEEVENQRLATVTGLSIDLRQAKAVNAVKTRIGGESRVLKSEIEMDRDRGVSVKAKEDKLADMKQKSSNLISKITDELADISEKADNISKPQEIISEKENERIDDDKDSMIEPTYEEIYRNSEDSHKVKE
ncbi:hypothetical protein RBU61_01330 [Tissierella sp. MB52-C2]|uniref:hypothetical protein n=1 Tax=Tissierella sp. MB52-C2 TaxID=3070999 RepID=UPI00280AEED4|nr:hypothetical protein [Tissierella sp. MB52-C2]WMM25333.1 hypothetical protein RBU61_01330 [Tissierella sp. MB52-C2]